MTILSTAGFHKVRSEDRNFLQIRTEAILRSHWQGALSIILFLRTCRIIEEVCNREK